MRTSTVPGDWQVSRLDLADLLLKTATGPMVSTTFGLH